MDFMPIQILIIVLVTALVSSLGGFVVANNKTGGNQNLNIHDRLKPMHAHDPRELGDDEPFPTIELIAHPDPKSGYNLEIITTNFTFAPQRASTEYITGEGHAHLYINQIKIGRLYGHWHHIPSLPQGVNKIRVGLSGNDHTELTKNDIPIAAEITVEVE